MYENQSGSERLIDTHKTVNGDGVFASTLRHVDITPTVTSHSAPFSSHKPVGHDLSGIVFYVINVQMYLKCSLNLFHSYEVKHWNYFLTNAHILIQIALLRYDFDFQST